MRSNSDVSLLVEEHVGSTHMSLPRSMDGSAVTGRTHGAALCLGRRLRQRRDEAQTRTSDEWATTRSAPSSACPTPRMTAEEEREATRRGGGRCWHEQPPLHVRRQGMHVYVFVR